MEAIVLVFYGALVQGLERRGRLTSEKINGLCRLVKLLQVIENIRDSDFGTKSVGQKY